MTRALVMIVVSLAATTAAAAQDSTHARTAQVTYVSGGQVYVNVGREDGLADNAELSVLRGRDSTVAVLRVQYLSSHQAACAIVRGVTDVAPGDRVRFISAAPTATQTVATPPAAPRPARTSAARTGLHGRAGARYLTASAPGNGRLGQPAADLRLTGTDLAGSQFGLLVDARTRSSRSEFGGQTTLEDRTDVYQLALLWNAPGAPVRAVMGRQYLTAVSSIVLLDGVLGEFNRRRVSVGLFGGAEPEPALLGFSALVQDFGGYVQLRAAPDGPRRWWVTTGAVGSYRAGQTNRAFGFLQAGFSGPGLSVTGAQEVDYYGGARRAAGEHALSLTSSFVSASLHPSRGWNLDAGFDNRRSVRLYRDVVNPITTFDDGYRQGAWAAVSTGGFGSLVRTRLEARTTAGAGAGRSTALTASVGADRIGPYGARLSAWLRATRFQSTELHGWLYAARVGADPMAALHVEFDGGVRRETIAPVSIGPREIVWLGAEADLGIGRSWYLVASGSREHGPDDALRQLYVSLSYRF